MNLYSIRQILWLEIVLLNHGCSLQAEVYHPPSYYLKFFKKKKRELLRV